MIVCVGRTGLLLLLRDEERKEVAVLNPVAWQGSFSLFLTKCFTSFVSYVRSTT